MTQLMLGTVSFGTGQAADIGRPTAGKTGTTTSNKDGWFIGFSSGLVTGVWMGKDNAKPVPGLQGGRAPARAFHDYMIKAVKERPIAEFTQSVLPKNPVSDKPDSTQKTSKQSDTPVSRGGQEETKAETTRQPEPAPRPAPVQAEKTTTEPPSGRSRAIRPDQ